MHGCSYMHLSIFLGSFISKDMSRQIIISFTLHLMKRFPLSNSSSYRICFGLHLSRLHLPISFSETKGFYRLTIFLFSGMTLFLIISTIYPNGQILRPTVFERDNIFVDMVKQLYIADTPTNIFPSLHVYNTIGACIAIMHSEKLKQFKKIQYGSLILGTLIILSTMFLKQHSVLDVIGAGLMSVVFYLLAYATELKRVPDLSHQLV